MIDWRFIVDEVVPNAQYSWQAPAEASKYDIYGSYDYIIWEDARKKPSQKELETAWSDYVVLNGTPEEEQATKKAQKEAALARLKLSHNAEIADLLKLLT